MYVSIFSRRGYYLHTSSATDQPRKMRIHSIRNYRRILEPSCIDSKVFQFVDNKKTCPYSGIWPEFSGDLLYAVLVSRASAAINMATKQTVALSTHACLRRISLLVSMETINTDWVSWDWF